MSSDSYRSQIVQAQKREASLRVQHAKHAADAQKARAEAARKRSQAYSTKSGSLAQSYMRTADNEERKAVSAEQKLTSVAKDIAQNSDKLRRLENSMQSALKAEHSAAARKQKSEQVAADRENERRQRKEKDHAREVGRLMSMTIRHVVERPAEPGKLRVLYLTASPPGETALRVDAEVNSVLAALRGTKLRDRIELHLRPAASPDDLVNGMNDLRPHVVHFSGHGNAEGLAFDNASVVAPELQGLSFATLAKLLKATDERPKLALLNSCNSVSGAAVLNEAIPVVIAMSGSVADMSAGLFARYFYEAIGGGQSIGHAVDQANARLEIALPDESSLVEVSCADGVMAEAIYLVAH